MAAARLPLPAASRCPQNTRGPCMVCAILHPIAPIAQVILCTIFRFLRKCPTCRLCLPQPQGVLFHNHRRNQFPERLSCHEKREKKKKRETQATRDPSAQHKPEQDHPERGHQRRPVIGRPVRSGCRSRRGCHGRHQSASGVGRAGPWRGRCQGQHTPGHVHGAERACPRRLRRPRDGALPVVGAERGRPCAGCRRLPIQLALQVFRSARESVMPVISR